LTCSFSSQDTTISGLTLFFDGDRFTLRGQTQFDMLNLSRLKDSLAVDEPSGNQGFDCVLNLIVLLAIKESLPPGGALFF
jgi:hypothetical protein